MASAAVVEKGCDAGSSASNKAVICKYFINGVCREGKTCRYSHNQESASPDMVCRYYLYGCCSYGSMCRYDHVKPKGNSGTTGPHPSATKQTTTLPPLPPTSKRGSAAPPLPLPPHQQAAASTLSPVAPQNGFCRPNPIGWELGQLDQRHSGTPDDNDTRSSVPWSTAPSTSDKVILRGGRIKTKADWAKDSQEFVPRKPISAPNLTYAQALHVEAAGALSSSPQQQQQQQQQPLQSLEPSTSEAADPEDCSAPEYTPKFDYPDPVFQKKLLCPYLEHGACPDMDNCCYLHGDLCEMCQTNVLHPTDMEQRKKHEEECVRKLEENMEYSFLIAGSEGKECTICMETVLDKKPPDNRFGLLSNCNHTFCLSCIRKWRACNLEKDVIRSCPQCRTASNFVTPSNVWVEDKEQKEKIINDYKEKMRKKPCKYFDQGRQKCPFGDSCFYKHAFPDGTLAPPEKPGSRRHRANADGAVSCMPEHSLWDFIFEREQGAAAVAMEAFIDEDFYNLIWTSSESGDEDDDDDEDDYDIFGIYDADDFIDGRYIYDNLIAGRGWGVGGDDDDFVGFNYDDFLDDDDGGGEGEGGDGDGDDEDDDGNDSSSSSSSSSSSNSSATDEISSSSSSSNNNTSGGETNSSNSGGDGSKVVSVCSSSSSSSSSSNGSNSIIISSSSSSSSSSNNIKNLCPSTATTTTTNTTATATTTTNNNNNINININKDSNNDGNHQTHLHHHHHHRHNHHHHHHHHHRGVGDGEEEETVVVAAAIGGGRSRGTKEVAEEVKGEEGDGSICDGGRNKNKKKQYKNKKRNGAGRS